MDPSEECARLHAELADLRKAANRFLRAKIQADTMRTHQNLARVREAVPLTAQHIERVQNEEVAATLALYSQLGLDPPVPSAPLPERL